MKYDIFVLLIIIAITLSLGFIIFEREANVINQPLTETFTVTNQSNQTYQTSYDIYKIISISFYNNSRGIWLENLTFYPSPKIKGNTIIFPPLVLDNISQIRITYYPYYDMRG